MMCPLTRQCPPNTILYNIKAGDTYYKLAEQFQTTIQAIAAANPHANPYNLLIGQTLCIPTSSYPTCPSGNYYVVKAGDTFFRISRLYNISLDILLDANPGIIPENLYIGQIICIPLADSYDPCAPNQRPYTIQRGDTFYSIARRYNIKLDLLLKANPRVNPDALLIGQKICIPILWSTYTNETFKVRLMYPSTWTRVDTERYEGIDGFFQISAIYSNKSLEEVCREEAYHNLMPYGSAPVIREGTLSGQPACFIYPSSDQPAEMRNQASAITKYKVPITVQGQEYNYFIIWASKEHIKEITDTIELF